jgi:hypothetical protein
VNDMMYRKILPYIDKVKSLKRGIIEKKQNWNAANEEANRLQTVYDKYELEKSR